MRIAEINITPLIDVMLVLLILFMVITPASLRSLDASVPQRSATDTPVRISVLTVSERAYALDRRPAASLDEIAERLRDAFRAGQPPAVLVEVEGEPSYGRVVDAMDTARGAGAERIGLRVSDPGRP